MIITAASVFGVCRARRQYWEDLEPASGRPYSSAFSHPDNWGVTAVSYFVICRYEGRSKRFATQYDAQMTQAKFLCYYSI